MDKSVESCFLTVNAGYLKMEVLVGTFRILLRFGGRLQLPCNWINQPPSSTVHITMIHRNGFPRMLHAPGRSDSEDGEICREAEASSTGARKVWDENG